MAHVQVLSSVSTEKLASTDSFCYPTKDYSKNLDMENTMSPQDGLPTVMITVYGQPKKRKTSDMLAAFPNALFIGVPSALCLVAQNELGFTPSVYEHPPQTLPDLISLLEHLSKQKLSDRCGAVVIDDASHLCKRSMLQWEEEAPVGRSGRKDRFYQYQQLDRHLLHLAGLARHLDVHMAMNFHERMPGSNADGHFCPGGPDVPSRNQVKTLPSWCDINVRAMVDPSYPDPWFPGAYYCDPTDPEWITGDRTGVCAKKTPGNLREILRASQSNYHLGRVNGLEWQDEVADLVANAILQDVSVTEAIQNAVSGYKKDQLHLRWACQDGIARGVLAKQQSRSLFNFEPEPEAPTTNGLSLPPPPPPS